MKTLHTLVLAVAALACGTAGAATYQNDQERRDQNREEALSKWRAQNGTSTGQRMHKESMRERAHDGKTSVREKTHETAQSVRNFTHRQAEKSRRFTERQDRAAGKKTQINTSPEGGGK